MKLGGFAVPMARTVATALPPPICSALSIPLLMSNLIGLPNIGLLKIFQNTLRTKGRLHLFITAAALTRAA